MANNVTPLQSRPLTTYFQFDYEVVNCDGAKFTDHYCTYSENSAQAIDRCRAEAKRKHNYKSIWIKNIY